MMALLIPELLEYAYHEAGHVVAALEVGRLVDRVWVKPEAGCAHLQLLPDCPTVAQVREQLLIDVAGWVASALADTNGSPVPPRFQPFVSQKLHYVSRKLREAGVLTGLLEPVLAQRLDEA